MGTKRQAVVLTSLILGAVLILSACGVSTSTRLGMGGAAATPGATPARSDRPDRVLITVDAVAFATTPPDWPSMPMTINGVTHPVLTLSDAALVRQLYATVFALPTLSPLQACTADAGPHYRLTFLQGTATLETVEAHREGCWPVTIASTRSLRQATRAFWEQLDHAIYLATPPLKPDRLAVAVAPDAGQAPQTTLITSAATAQQVYDAILALPMASGAQAAQSCYTESGPGPAERLVFFAGEDTASASVSDKCQTVEVTGGYQWRGGDFAMNDQFRSLLQAVLAGATFGPARPDHLAVWVTTAQTASPYVYVSDRQLMLALYSQVFSLAETKAQPGCPPLTDKLAGKGTSVTLTFIQWHLPLAQIDTYEGSCRYVQRFATVVTSQRLQATPAFWDLVHRASAR